MLAFDPEESCCEFDLQSRLLLDVDLAAQEREQILEELDALMDRKVFLQLYMRATDEKHSFWYINLLNEQDAMFYRNFDQKMLVVDKDAHAQVSSASQETRIAR